jgi:pyruvate dehydrogenase E2 component (dihydrolipoamide acetyltransferase)
MAKSVIMPRFGMTQEEAEIVHWLCAEGDRVEQGDPICEVTTDKVNMEVEAPATGRLTDIRFQAGDTVPVTQIIAYITSEQEYQTRDNQAADKEPVEPVNQSTPQPAAPPVISATPLAQRIAAEAGLPLENIQGSGTRGKITRDDIQRALNSREEPDNTAGESGRKLPASPAARSLANQLGIDLKAISGTGPLNRIQGWDVQKFHQALVKSAGSSRLDQEALIPPYGVQSPDGNSNQDEVEIIPLEGMRKTIADRLQASYQQAPHIFLTIEIDMGRALALRAALNPRQPAGREPVSLTALIVKASALALHDQPLLNSHLLDGNIHRFKQINIGMAVALEDGLIVPVIHAADQKGLNWLGDKVADLSQRARSGKLRANDITGGTFTISNLGMFGIDQFTAIINPPQVGILAVGQIARRFVPDQDDQPVARSLMKVCLSADHRVIDGLVAARFLSALRDRLENPNLLLD